MEIQDIAEKKPAAAGPMNKKIMIIIAIAAAVIVIIAGFMINKQNQHIEYAVGRVVDELLDCVDYRPYYIGYPVLADNDSVWKPGGYYDEVKDNKKLTVAINNALLDFCTNSEGEFSPSGIGRVYRIAAVLEYLDYENAQVKECIDSLTAQALEAEKSASTSNSVYSGLLPFDSLTYYTGRKEMLQNAEIEAYYNARWQEVKQNMASDDELDDFIEDVYEVASRAPVKIPEPMTSKASSSDYATAVNAVAINQLYLDIEKIMPYEELRAALQQYGQEAVFRNGQGGYYDSHNIDGTRYGDFAVRFVSGRVKRTGNEDEFTEQYLREHYDSPDKTYRYFRGETIGQFPPFFSDTRQVFVYNNVAYAFTDYAVYYNDIMLPYDYEAAKEAEFKHVTVSEQTMIENVLSSELASYLRYLSDFQPTYQYDVENSMVKIYLKALPGTTEALQAGQMIPFSRQETFVAWNDFVDFLCNLTDDIYSDLSISSIGGLYYALGNDSIGVGLIVSSDVNAEAGLLSVLNGEVVQDNSANPPAPATDTETPENPEENAEN